MGGANSESEGEDNDDEDDDEHKANFISQILEMLGQFLKEVSQPSRIDFFIQAKKQDTRKAASTIYDDVYGRLL